MAVLLIRRKQRQKTDIDNRETNGQFHLTQLVTAVINCTSATWINLLNSSGYILHNHHLYKSVIPAATSYMATMEVYLIPVATLWVITICRSLYDSSGNTLHAHILWNSTWFQWPEFTWSLFVEVYMISMTSLHDDCGSLHDSSSHTLPAHGLWKATWLQWHTLFQTTSFNSWFNKARWIAKHSHRICMNMMVTQSLRAFSPKWWQEIYT